MSDLFVSVFTEMFGKNEARLFRRSIKTLIMKSGSVGDKNSGNFETVAACRFHVTVR